MNAALTLRLRHALHALCFIGQHNKNVNTTFGSKNAVGTLTRDLHDGFLDAAGEREEKRYPPPLEVLSDKIDHFQSLRAQ